MRLVDCPWCEGIDEGGCCACDHTGKVDAAIWGDPPLDEPGHRAADRAAKAERERDEARALVHDILHTLKVTNMTIELQINALKPSARK